MSCTRCREQTPNETKLCDSCTLHREQWMANWYADCKEREDRWDTDWEERYAKYLASEKQGLEQTWINCPQCSQRMRSGFKCRKCRRMKLCSEREKRDRDYAVLFRGLLRLPKDTVLHRSRKLKH
jgi:hypothetical protein